MHRRFGVPASLVVMLLLFVTPLPSMAGSAPGDQVPVHSPSLAPQLATPVPASDRLPPPPSCDAGNGRSAKPNEAFTILPGPIDSEDFRIEVTEADLGGYIDWKNESEDTVVLEVTIQGRSTHKTPLHQGAMYQMYLHSPAVVCFQVTVDGESGTSS